MPTEPRVVSVSRDSLHRFSKAVTDSITLIAGVGVEGDAHAGVTVQHRSRAAADPTQPNLRQVHLIHAELHEELRQQGFNVAPGELGENITTAGVDVLNLPRDTVLQLGTEAAVQVTGLRNPCSQIDELQGGLLKAVLCRDEQGNVIRKTGVMGIVLQGGVVRPGDSIRIAFPEGEHFRLERV